MNESPFRQIEHDGALYVLARAKDGLISTNVLADRIREMHCGCTNYSDPVAIDAEERGYARAIRNVLAILDGNQ